MMETKDIHDLLDGQQITIMTTDVTINKITIDLITIYCQHIYTSYIKGAKVSKKTRMSFFLTFQKGYLLKNC